MSNRTRDIVQKRLDTGDSFREIADMLKTPPVSYSHEAVRRWLDPENEPRFSDMYFISQFTDNEDARGFAVDMCQALRPDLISEAE